MPLDIGLPLAWRLLFPPCLVAIGTLMFWLSYVGPRGMHRPLLRALTLHAALFLLGVLYAMSFEDVLWRTTHFEWSWLLLAALWTWLVFRDAQMRYWKPASPSHTQRARGRERWLAAGWMIALAAALIAWGMFADKLASLLSPALITLAAAATLAWPGARKARAAAGLRGLLPLAIIGAIGVHTWSAAALVAALALALWLLTRGGSAPRYQDLSEITRG